MTVLVIEPQTPAVAWIALSAAVVVLLALTGLVVEWRRLRRGARKGAPSVPRQRAPLPVLVMIPVLTALSLPSWWDQPAMVGLFLGGMVFGALLVAWELRLRRLCRT